MRRRWVLIQISVLALVAGQAWSGGSGEPAPYPDFTFKRVGVPQAGTPRIMVQIDPAAQAAALGIVPAGEEAPAQVDTPGAAGGEDAYAWFWADVSADMDNGGPANLSRALAALRANPGNPAPRLQICRILPKPTGRTFCAPRWARIFPRRWWWR